MTAAASVAGDSAASPQRSEAPGPSSQSAQRTTRASVSTSWAPTTPTISSMERALRTRSSTGPSRSRCFGEPKRDEAPAAKTTAETMAHIVHTRVTDTSGFPSYARRGEEAGYALDHASTSNEAPAWGRQAFAGALTASTARRIRARAICTLYAVPGSGVACSSASADGKDQGIGATPAKAS